jgi:hypothetical protein
MPGHSLTSPMGVGPSHPYRLRRASPRDAGPLAGLCSQLGYPSSPGALRHRLAGILPRDDHAVYIAETPDGQLAGFVHVYLRLLLEVDLHAAIGGLVVD